MGRGERGYTPADLEQKLIERGRRHRSRKEPPIEQRQCPEHGPKQLIG